MRPCVARDLVALGVHALDGGYVGWGSVDWTLVDIGASDKESGLSTVFLEEVQDMVGVALVGAIVECEGDGAGLLARVDTGTSIRYGADLGTGYSGGGGSSWGYVLRAGRAKFVLATGRVAVIGRVAAPCMLLVSIIRSTREEHTSSPAAAVSRIA